MSVMKEKVRERERERETKKEEKNHIYKEQESE